MQLFTFSRVASLFCVFALVSVAAGVANGQSGSRNSYRAPVQSPTQSYAPAQTYAPTQAFSQGQYAPVIQQASPAYSSPGYQSAFMPQTGCGIGGCSSSYQPSYQPFYRPGYFQPIRSSYRPFFRGYRSHYGSSCGGY